jgi:hypothetical protein
MAWEKRKKDEKGGIELLNVKIGANTIKINTSLPHGCFWARIL